MGLPKFVKLGRSSLRYREEENDYYRDAGDWEVGYKIENDTLISVSCMDWLDGLELKETDRDTYIEENEPYCNPSDF